MHKMLYTPAISDVKNNLNVSFSHNITSLSLMSTWWCRCPLSTIFCFQSRQRRFYITFFILSIFTFFMFIFIIGCNFIILCRCVFKLPPRLVEKIHRHYYPKRGHHLLRTFSRIFFIFLRTSDSMVKNNVENSLNQPLYLD